MSKVILFQGDSVTDVLRNYEDDNYAGSGYANMVKGQLGYTYPNEYVFYNRGISGNRIVDIYARIKKDILNLKPDYLSILIGINDIWHEIWFQNGVSAPKFEKVYTMLIEEILEELPDIKIMIIEPFVLEGTATCNTEEIPDKYGQFYKGTLERAAAAKRVAEKFGLPFITMQKRLEAALEKAPADYWLIDGVHPTAAGHNMIKEAWIEEFEKIK